ncbi:MAG: hypothetical protein CFE39_05395 [Comamonadaceae bacterium PBBC2]|nr:MAG: hypothetical protein CFE39_05395 [Comamonadaceae bacterium PBBC2]
MAIDSLFGGNDTVVGSLSDDTQALLNSLLTSSVGGSSTVEIPTPGSLYVSSEGSFGQDQGALVSTSLNVGITAQVDSGNLALSVQLPPGVGVAFQGLDEKSPEEAAQYFSNALDLIITSNDPGIVAYKETLSNLVKEISEAISSTGAKMSVRFVAFSNDDSQTRAATNEVYLDVTGKGGSSSTELVAVVMSSVAAGKTLVLSGVEGALLVGAGTARIDGFKGAYISGDQANQKIIGGAGRDTILGGGGTDTITGGSGADVFGFSKLSGNMIITDFQVGVDKLGFGGTITSVSDLAPKFTGLTQNADGVTLSFGSDASITLVGVSVEQLSLDMLKFGL